MTKAIEGSSDGSTARGSSGSATGLPLRPASQLATEYAHLLTVNEAAHMLGLAPKTVRKLISYRMLEAVRVGVGLKRAPYRVSRQAVQRYIASRTMPTQP